MWQAHPRSNGQVLTEFNDTTFPTYADSLFVQIFACITCAALFVIFFALDSAQILALIFSPDLPLCNVVKNTS